MMIIIMIVIITAFNRHFKTASLALVDFTSIALESKCKIPGFESHAYKYPKRDFSKQSMLNNLFNQ